MLFLNFSQFIQPQSSATAHWAALPEELGFSSC